MRSHPKARAHEAPPTHAEHGGRGRPEGHDQHAGHSVAMFRDRFWLSLTLSVPVLIWSEMLQSLLGYSAPGVPGDRWLPLVFGTAVFALRRLAVPSGRRAGVARTRARHDAADLTRDHRRVRLELGE